MTNAVEAAGERIAELERMLKQRTAELRAAQKELDGLSYSVSHDLRAPLRHIKGYAQILAADFSAGLEPQCRQYLEKIQDSAHKMSGMLEELLKLSRLSRQELRRQRASLDTLLADLVRDLDRGYSPRKVEWKIAALPTLDCDAVLIRQVFSSLLSNALKATRSRPQAVIEVGTMRQDGHLVFFVRDNGVGFDMKYADKLFTIFQRLHPQQEFEGIGAGLAMAQRIVQKHGGRMWAEAAASQGATFYFTVSGRDKGQDA
jgi:light-regulated signal transduction histidine kinase (bacteriophytochrome)